MMRSRSVAAPLLVLGLAGLVAEAGRPEMPAGLEDAVIVDSDGNRLPDGEYTEDYDVLELTSNNWDQWVPQEKFMMIEFYAPWCGHCKKLAPVYGELATMMKKAKHPVKVAKVNADVEDGLRMKYRIDGFPTLKTFVYGKMRDYNGPKDLAALAHYLLSNAGPAAAELHNTTHIMDFVMPQHDSMVICVFAEKYLDETKKGEEHPMRTGPRNGKAHKVFESVAEEHRGKFPFAYTFNLTAAAQAPMFGLGGKLPKKDLCYVIKSPRYLSEHERMGTSVSMRPFATAFGGDQGFFSWVNKNDIPLMGEMTLPNQYRYARHTRRMDCPLVTIYFDVDYKSKGKQTGYIANRLRKVAKAFEGQAVFAMSNIDVFYPQLERFGLPVEDYAVSVEDHAGRRWGFDGLVGQENMFNAEPMSGWLTRVLAGKEEEYMTSAEAPEGWDKSPVKELVARTFREVVWDMSKDVLIEFYAPWCGHCKQLAPVYDELAELFSRIPDQPITMAKMDATANDVPQPYEAKGYPTIYIAPANEAGKKTPTLFAGERTAKALRRFVAEHAARSHIRTFKIPKLPKPAKAKAKAAEIVEETVELEDETVEGFDM